MAPARLILAAVLAWALAGCGAPNAEGVVQIAYAGWPWWAGGSATVVDVEGDHAYALTCDHCVHDPRIVGRARVDKQELEILASSEACDLAVVRWQVQRGADVHAYGIAEHPPAVGDRVWAVGWAITREVTGTHRLGRHVNAGRVSWLSEMSIGHTAATCSGYSGGALLDAWGRLVGIHEGVHPGADDHSIAVRTEWLRAIWQLSRDRRRENHEQILEDGWAVRHRPRAGAAAVLHRLPGRGDPGDLYDRLLGRAARPGRADTGHCRRRRRAPGASGGWRRICFGSDQRVSKGDDEDARARDGPHRRRQA